MHWITFMINEEDMKSFYESTSQVVLKYHYYCFQDRTLLKSKPATSCICDFSGATGLIFENLCYLSIIGLSWLLNNTIQVNNLE